jgi:hypothetical protein
MNNNLDTPFRKLRYMLVDYVLLIFRIDRITIPPLLMKIRTMKKEAAWNVAHYELIENASAVSAIHKVCWSMSFDNTAFTPSGILHMCLLSTCQENG